MQPLSIDLSSPHVQRTLGGATGNPGVMQLAGDPSTGLNSCIRLTEGKHEVVVIYRDMFLTVDVYVIPGEPPKLHMYCPRCHKHSTVPGARKAIDFEPLARNPLRTEIRATGSPDLIALADLGRLSVATFECPWEIGDDQHVAGRVHTGASLCRLRLAIDNNRAKDA